MTGVFVLIIVVDVTKCFTALQEKQARVFVECHKMFYVIRNKNKLECLLFTCVFVVMTAVYVTKCFTVLSGMIFLQMLKH